MGPVFGRGLDTGMYALGNIQDTVYCAEINTFKAYSIEINRTRAFKTKAEGPCEAFEKSLGMCNYVSPIQEL